MSGIYLDNNATTRVDDEVVQAMLPFFTEQFGSPSSMHSFGNQVGMALKEGAAERAAAARCRVRLEIVFTSCGTGPIPPRSSRRSRPSPSARRSSPRWSSTRRSSACATTWPRTATPCTSSRWTRRAA